MTAYDPERLRPAARHLERYHSKGVAFLGAVGAGGWVVSEGQRIGQDGVTLSTGLYLGLLTTTALLAGMWAWATGYELDLLTKWLDPKKYVPPTALVEVALASATVGFLGVLAFASRTPPVYCALFAAFNAFVLLMVRRTTREIGQAIAGSRDRLRDLGDSLISTERSIYVRALDILERYYIQRPHARRHFFVFASGLIPLALALWPSTSQQLWVEEVVYVTLIAIIVVSEFILGWWRQSRDNGLRPLWAEIVEIRATA